MDEKIIDVSQINNKGNKYLTVDVVEYKRNHIIDKQIILGWKNWHGIIGSRTLSYHCLLCCQYVGKLEHNHISSYHHMAAVEEKKNKILSEFEYSIVSELPQPDTFHCGICNITIHTLCKVRLHCIEDKHVGKLLNSKKKATNLENLCEDVKKIWEAKNEIHLETEQFERDNVVKFVNWNNNCEDNVQVSSEIDNKSTDDSQYFNNRGSKYFAVNAIPFRKSYILNRSIILHWKNWHGITGSKRTNYYCNLCCEYIGKSRQDHVFSKHHEANLEKKRTKILTEFQNSIISELPSTNNFHCGVCNVVIHTLGGVRLHCKESSHLEEFLKINYEINSIENLFEDNSMECDTTNEIRLKTEQLEKDSCKHEVENNTFNDIVNNKHEINVQVKVSSEIDEKATDDSQYFNNRGCKYFAVNVVPFRRRFILNRSIILDCKNWHGITGSKRTSYYCNFCSEDIGQTKHDHIVSKHHVAVIEERQNKILNEFQYSIISELPSTDLFHCGVCNVVIHTLCSVRLHCKESSHCQELLKLTYYVNCTETLFEDNSMECDTTNEIHLKTEQLVRDNSVNFVSGKNEIKHNPVKDSSEIDEKVTDNSQYFTYTGSKYFSVDAVPFRTRYILDRSIVLDWQNWHCITGSKRLGYYCYLCLENIGKSRQAHIVSKCHEAALEEKRNKILTEFQYSIISELPLTDTFHCAACNIVIHTLWFVRLHCKERNHFQKVLKLTHDVKCMENLFEDNSMECDTTNEISLKTEQLEKDNFVNFVSGKNEIKHNPVQDSSEIDEKVTDDSQYFTHIGSKYFSVDAVPIRTRYILNRTIVLGWKNWHSITGSIRLSYYCYLCCENIGKSRHAHIVSKRHEAAIKEKRNKILTEFQYSIISELPPTDTFHCGVCNFVISTVCSVRLHCKESEHLKRKLKLTDTVKYITNFREDVSQICETTNEIQLQQTPPFNRSSIDNNITCNNEINHTQFNDDRRQDGKVEISQEMNGKIVDDSQYFDTKENKYLIVNVLMYRKKYIINRRIVLGWKKWHGIIGSKKKGYYCYLCSEDIGKLKQIHMENKHHAGALKEKNSKILSEFQYSIVSELAEEDMYHCGICNESIKTLSGVRLHYYEEKHSKTLKVSELNGQKTIDKLNKFLQAKSLLTEINDKIYGVETTLHKSKENIDINPNSITYSSDAYVIGREINEVNVDTGINKEIINIDNYLKINIIEMDSKYLINGIKLVMEAYNCILSFHNMKFCALCGVDVYNLLEHYTNLAHQELVREKNNRILSKYGSSIISEMPRVGVYHCGVCNIVVTDIELTEHCSTQEHGEEKNKCITQNNIFSYRKQSKFYTDKLKYANSEFLKMWETLHENNEIDEIYSNYLKGYTESDEELENDTEDDTSDSNKYMPVEVDKLKHVINKTRLCTYSYHCIVGIKKFAFCALCGVDVFDKSDHCTNLKHIQLVEKKNEKMLAKFGSSFISELPQPDMYHCGLCNVVISRSNLNDHCNTRDHDVRKKRAAKKYQNMLLKNRGQTKTDNSKSHKTVLLPYNADTLKNIANEIIQVHQSNFSEFSIYRNVDTKTNAEVNLCENINYNNGNVLQYQTLRNNNADDVLQIIHKEKIGTYDDKNICHIKENVPTARTVDTNIVEIKNKEDLIGDMFKLASAHNISNHIVNEIDIRPDICTNSNTDAKYLTIHSIQETIGFVINDEVSIPLRHWHCLMGKRLKSICALCNVNVSRERHIRGEKHLENLEKRKKRILSEFGYSIITELPKEDMYHCGVCNCIIHNISNVRSHCSDDEVHLRRLCMKRVLKNPISVPIKTQIFEATSHRNCETICNNIPKENVATAENELGKLTTKHVKEKSMPQNNQKEYTIETKQYPIIFTLKSNPFRLSYNPTIYDLNFTQFTSDNNLFDFNRINYSDDLIKVDIYATPKTLKKESATDVVKKILAVIHNNDQTLRGGRFESNDIKEFNGTSDMVDEVTFEASSSKQPMTGSGDSKKKQILTLNKNNNNEVNLGIKQTNEFERPFKNQNEVMQREEIDEDRYLEIELKKHRGIIINNKILISNRHWHCINYTKPLKCFLCQVSFESKNMALHKATETHQEFLKWKQSKVLKEFGDSIITEILDLGLYHCGICNITIESWYEVRNHCKEDTHIINLRESQARCRALISKNPATESNVREELVVKSFYNVPTKGILINREIAVPKKNWHTLIERNKHIYCCICNIEFFKAASFLHYNDVRHLENIPKYPYMCGTNLIIELPKNRFYCGICGNIWNALHKHLNSRTHVNNFRQAVKLADNIIKSDRVLS